MSDFIGRTTEVERLVQALSQPQPRGMLAVIGGPASNEGIGKTELAYVVAQRLQPVFPDGHLLLALRSSNHTPLSAEQALQSVIRAFIPLYRPPDNPALLQKHYFSLLQGKRLLLVADDAHSAEQLRLLQPPAGCALLVTSAQPLALPGVEMICLEPLSQPAAEQLVVTLAPRLGRVAPHVAQLCGGVPLALRICTSLLANESQADSAGYLEILTDERKYLARPGSRSTLMPEVEAALNLSYEALHPAAQAALCQMSIFPASFDKAAAAAVLSLDEYAEGDHLPFDALLALLCSRSLLEWNPLTKRYNLHSAIRTFARARLEGEPAIRRRYAQHYLQVVRQAGNMCRQNDKPQLQAGLVLFEQERSHIDAAWNWLRRQQPSRATDALVLGYAIETAALAHWHYGQHERIPQLEDARKAARRMGNQRAEAMLLGALSTIYKDIGSNERADSYEKQRQRVLQKPPPARPKARPLQRLVPAPLPVARECSLQAFWWFWGFLGLLLLTEIGLSFVNLHLGMVLYALLLLGANIYVAAGPRNAERKLMLALSLVPLMRLLSLTIPASTLSAALQHTPSQFGAIAPLLVPALVALLMLVASYLAIRQLRIPRRKLLLTPTSPWLYLLLVATGIGMGSLDYTIPLQQAINSMPLANHLIPFTILLLIGIAVAEELIFRGVIQTMAVPALGQWSLLYTSLLFALLHIHHRSIQAACLAFLVGMLFAYVVYWNGAILGVVVAHSVANLTRFFLAPHLGTAAREFITNLAPAIILSGVVILAMSMVMRRYPSIHTR